jgi:cysteine synthase A
VDRQVCCRAVDRFRGAGILLPTFAELAVPCSVPAGTREALARIKAEPLNLFRVRWYNDRGRTCQAAVPVHVVLPSEFTGIGVRIVVAIGDLFPIIRAHKVLAAYGCLAPRIITGQFDPTRHRAVWPSTGNYCPGRCRDLPPHRLSRVAVLPEGASRERFGWLEDWVADAGDIIRTRDREQRQRGLRQMRGIVGWPGQRPRYMTTQRPNCMKTLRQGSVSISLPPAA